jgi:hypothetical protein
MFIQSNVEYCATQFCVFHVQVLLYDVVALRIMHTFITKSTNYSLPSAIFHLHACYCALFCTYVYYYAIKYSGSKIRAFDVELVIHDALALYYMQTLMTTSTNCSLSNAV